MIAVAADEDRLPWLDDLADADTRRTPSVSWLVALLFVATAVAIGLLWLRVPDPADWPLLRSSSGASEPEPVALPPDPSACARICAQWGYAQPPARSDGVGAPGVALSPPAGSLEEARQLPAPSRGEAVGVQLGAYCELQDAEAGWQHLSERFALLRDHSRVITPPAGEGDRFFRLRVHLRTEEQARALCAELKRAGEDCFLLR